jgi:hypothetical protein
MQYALEIMLVEIRMGLRYADVALSAKNPLESKLNAEHGRAAYDAALKLRDNSHLTPLHRDTGVRGLFDTRLGLRTRQTRLPSW